jgi:signal transduction histidine kinase
MAVIASGRGGNGLGNIKYRAAEIGAELKFITKPQQGTTIKLMFGI